jgi:phosphoesterase RecJ-like protein
MFEDVLESIRSRRRFAITSHVKPDGDALGSEIALMLALRSLGKEAVVINRDPVPPRYNILPASDQVRVFDRICGDYDLVFVLECGSLARTGLADLEARTLANIDHHASTPHWACINWIDPEACAVGEMVFRIAKALGAPITRELATNIYTAIVTDTGSFQFASTTAATFRMAAELADAGADVAEIARNIFYSNPITKVNAMTVMLNRMKLDGGGRIVWTVVTRDDMIRHNCMEEDVEGLVNFPLTISGVDVAVLFRELEDGSFRVSLRSKNAADVSQVAIAFGGGGHRYASGCRLAGPFETVKNELISEVIRTLHGKMGT